MLRDCLPPFLGTRSIRGHNIQRAQKRDQHSDNRYASRSMKGFYLWGFPKIRATFLGGPNMKAHSGAPLFWETTISTLPTESAN